MLVTMFSLYGIDRYDTATAEFLVHTGNLYYAKKPVRLYTKIYK